MSQAPLNKEAAYAVVAVLLRFAEFTDSMQMPKVKDVFLAWLDNNQGGLPYKKGFLEFHQKLDDLLENAKLKEKFNSLLFGGEILDFPDDSIPIKKKVAGIYSKKLKQAVESRSILAEVLFRNKTVLDHFRNNFLAVVNTANAWSVSRRAEANLLRRIRHKYSLSRVRAASIKDRRRSLIAYLNSRENRFLVSNPKHELYNADCQKLRQVGAQQKHYYYKAPLASDTESDCSDTEPDDDAAQDTTTRCSPSKQLKVL